MQDKYNRMVVKDEKPLLAWLLANVGETKSKVKATLKNRGIKVNGKIVTQFDHQLKIGAVSYTHLTLPTKA